MIIKSIAVQDFQCYSGPLDSNIFEFKPGLNVIIGDNGSGKSKLYDAFYWLLYDKVFNSSTRSFEPTSHVGINLASDKAKASAQIGEFVEVIVQLLLLDQSDKGSVPTEYLLTRSIRLEKIKETDDFSDPSCWKIDSLSITKVEMKDILNFKPMPESGSFDRIVKLLLPPDMEPYLWFQGEQVDSLIDFKNEDSLTKAIDVLSGINIFDNYIEIATKVAKQANESYNREEREKLRLNNSAKENLLEKEKLEKLIDKEKDNLILIIDNLETAEQRKEELLGKIEDAKELEKLKINLESAKGEINQAQSLLNDGRRNFNNNLFRKKWLLRNAGKFSVQFEQMQKKYDERREDIKIERKLELQQEEARKHKLPENVPNRQYLEEMLNEKKCYLCDRSFIVGDPAHTYLSNVLERTKKKKVSYTDFLKQDIKKNIQDLYSNAYTISNYAIPRVDESIQEELEKLDNLQATIENKKQAYSTIEEKLNHLLTTGSVSQEDAKNIVRSFRESDDSKDRFVQNKFETEARLKQYKERLSIINRELKSSFGGKMNPDTLEKKEILDDFLEIALSTRDLVYEEQIKLIEELANTHFYQMTRENTSVQGKIILEKRGKSHMPKNVDENGVELTSINDSNIILIKLATILAIVSAKGGTEHHPLITDAPTSKFSDNYTIGFCKTISEIFNQSIIISYDFYHNIMLRERLLKEIENLGSVIVIEPSQPENQRMNRIDLSTKISSLN
ncbi:MAG: AAA family ATPase [Candidatus Paceibacterota bacterium]